MTKSALTDLCLTAYLILVWFVSGVTLLQGWGNYPTWLDMGPMMSNEDFMRLREAHYWLIYPLAVIPGMASVVLNAVLVFLKPPGISRPLLIALLILTIGISVATIVIQIPLQDQIDAKGYDREVIQRLIDTDLWTRKIPGLISMAGFAVVLFQAVRRRAGQG
jgi:hypothetical protein